MLSLPAALRSELRDPLGEVYTKPETLLSAVGAYGSTSEPALISVGDVVTARLLEAAR